MTHNIFSTLICLFLPQILKPYGLRLLGHSVHNSAKIGFSFVFNTKLFLDKDSKIGHLNFIHCKRLLLRSGARIGHMNRVHGPFSMICLAKASIGNRNSVRRANFPIVVGSAILKLGKLTKLTVNHYIDCTRSITIGNYSILAGLGAQIWTHGYMHAPEGPERYRVDGKVTIGNNVYIGSGAVLLPGIIIGNAVTVGANATVSSNLLEPGFYVNQALRRVTMDYSALPNRYQQTDLRDCGSDNILCKR